MTHAVLWSAATLLLVAFCAADDTGGSAMNAYRVIERHYGPDMRFNDWRGQGVELVPAGGTVQAFAETGGTVLRDEYPLPGGGDIELSLVFNFERFAADSALTVHFNRRPRDPDGFRIQIGTDAVTVTHNTREVYRSDTPIRTTRADEHTVRLVTLGEHYAVSLNGVELAAGRMDPPFVENEGRLALELHNVDVRLLACEECFIIADREFPPWRRTELLYEEAFGQASLDANWVCNGERTVVTDASFVFTHMSVNVCRMRFEAPIAVDCIVTPMPTDEYSAGITDLICIWMLDRPEGDLFEFMESLPDANLAHYMPLPFYWVDLGGTNNKTTRFRKNPHRQMVRQFSDRDRLLRRDKSYSITMVQDGDVVEFWVDGQCWIQRHDPNPIIVGHVGFRAFVAGLELSGLKVWRIAR